MNLAHLLHQSAPHYRDKPLLRFHGESVAFADFTAQVARLAGALRARGIAPGRRVMIVARNKPEWLATLFAVLQTGAMAIPVNPALTGAEVSYMVEHAGPDIVVVDADLRGVVPAASSAEVWELGGAGSGWHEAARDGEPSHDIADLSPDAPALMFYTSGTTGRPKGAVLSHAAEIFTAELVARHFRMRPDDVSLISNSLSFIYPLVIDCIGSIHAGATVALQDRFHPELCLRAIEQEKATIFMGVPTMFSMMLDWAQGKTVDVSCLRLCISAGQNLAWNVATRFQQRFGPALYDLWGQTEGTPITGYDPATEASGRPESCGRALPGCAVRVVDDHGHDLPPEAIGEVLLRGPNVFLGYDKNPTATTETLKDGWVYTGDLGKLDKDGYLYIVGRKRDLIIRGGANIYPTEVEEAIYAHPAVAECAVIGVPDPTYGELVKAVVVVAQGQRVTAQELTAHCRGRLAEYKVPAIVAFAEALPKGPTGKILKRELREQAKAATTGWIAPV